MKRMKRLISGALALIMVAAVCTSCADDEAILSVSEENAILQVQAADAYTPSDPNYQLMVENDDLALYVNQATTQFQVMDKANGAVYYSNPEGDEKSKTDVENSLFDLSYLDGSNQTGTLNSYADSVKKGQFAISKIDDGVKIQFTVGVAEPFYYCPYGISAERFEAIREKITDTFDRSQLVANYKKSGDLYVLSSETLSLRTKATIDRILKSTGYNDEDYEIDQRNGETAATTGVCFNIFLYLKLDGDRLVVDIPMSEISEFNGAVVTELRLLTNFAAPDPDDAGSYFLLPDGAGSIMNTYNGKGLTQDYRVPVYGRDSSNPPDEQIYQEEPAYLPVFGIGYTDKAVFATITDGAAIAEVMARTGNDQQHSGVYTMFRTSETARTYLGSTGGNEYFTISQEHHYEGSLQVTYKFFEADACQVSDMAAYYRSQLFGSDAVDADQPPIYIEFLGTIRRQNNILGIEMTKPNAYSTLEDVMTVGNELLDAGGKNLVFKLTGFFNNGVDTTSALKLKLNKEVGDKQDLQDLLNWASEKGVKLYFDVDPQYVYNTAFLDGFSTTKDTSYLLTKTVAHRVKYFPVDFTAWSSNDDSYLVNTPYIMNPAAVREAIGNIKATFSDLGIGGVSLRSVGSGVSSDYKKERMIERQKATNMLVEDLASLSDFSLLTFGANAYALPYMDHAISIPLNSSKYDNTDATIPFLQMVLQGNVAFADESVNLNGNTKTAVLDAVRSNAGFYYVLTTSEDSDMSKTQHIDYFSTSYKTWKEDILEKIDILNKDGNVLASGITNYETLANNVYRTTAQDGSYIVSNYSTAEYTYEGTTIAPGAYLTGKVGA